MLTHAQRVTLLSRADLLRDLCELKIERGLSWRGVFALMPEHTSGGSTLDRKIIAEAMVALEARDG